jgi:hypothetical protein
MSQLDVNDDSDNELARDGNPVLVPRGAPLQMSDYAFGVAKETPQPGITTQPADQVTTEGPARKRTKTLNAPRSTPARRALKVVKYTAGGIACAAVGAAAVVGTLLFAPDTLLGLA